MTDRKTPAAKAPAKRTPGSGDENDTSGVASTDKDNGKQDSGQKGRAEDQVRQDQIDAGVERAAKNAAETDTVQPVQIAPAADRPVFIGEEHRDETHDPGFEADDETLPQHDAFDFDYTVEPDRVEHVAVAQKDNGVIFEINDQYFALDAQLAAATRRLFQSAVTNLNL